MTYSSSTQQGGFTLIETVIVIALSASMMLMIGVLLFNFSTTSSYQTALTESSGSASALLREIESLTLPASEVLQTYTFSSSTRTSSSTALVLKIPSIDTAGNTITNTYDYAAFYVVGTKAYRLLEANVLSRRTSGTKQLSSTLNALTFTYNNITFSQVTTVTIDIQTRAQTKQQTLNDHRREQIRLRNH